jgi:hypothetical protein
MSQRQPDFSWLPLHQHHVALTLAHVDALIDRVGELLFDHLRHGPLQLANSAEADLCHVTVAGIAPLPAALSRYTADALTQMRAAIEHTIFAQVEHESGRKLNDAEARRVEMPSTTSAAAFSEWLRGRRRPDLAPLRDGTQLCQRLRDLQPFQHQDFERHPLRILAEHTNLAKHRTPAVAATLLGAVIPDIADPDLVIASGVDRPLQVGDRLVSGPRNKRVPLSIWPKVSIQRPHTETWHVLMHELGELESWVRTVAVPHLVAGTKDVDPLPPQLDITIGHTDLPASLRDAGRTPAAARMTTRIQATLVRDNIADILALHGDSCGPEIIAAWLASLSDDAMLERQRRISEQAGRGDLGGVDAAARELIAEARRMSTAG